MNEALRTIEPDRADRYRFDARCCRYCGGRWHLTTGWLEGIGPVWKCKECRERYVAEKELEEMKP